MIEADLEHALDPFAHPAALSEARRRLDRVGPGVLPAVLAGAAPARE
jgi:hypothetical protein